MLSGKVAVVTGGGKGIGKSITLKLAEAGTHVIVLQRTELDEELRALTNVSWLYADIADLETIKSTSKFINNNYDSIDIIVNNAGIMPESKIENLSLDEWQKGMVSNSTYPLFLIKSLLGLMTKNGQGSIINIGSIEGIGVNPNHITYSASKAALHAITRSLAVDLGSYGIRCNAIAPGWIDTELNSKFAGSLTSEKDYQEALVRLHPVGRTGKPGDIANLVRFLACDDSSFITGQVIIIDGGRTTMLPLPL